MDFREQATLDTTTMETAEWETLDQFLTGKNSKLQYSEISLCVRYYTSRLWSKRLESTYTYAGIKDLMPQLPLLHISGFVLKEWER